ncbi:MAG: hypothetical protein PHY92_10050 [Alphaproteobacteria bacterium]|nr:hypothetical protein [Alphaproteobacteria bacterium]
MKIELSEALGRHAPLALVAALLIQGATVVWWASAKERDGFFLEQRVTSLETTLSHTAEAQTQTLERLARIEERVNAQLAVLDRIERQLGAPRK